MIEIENLSVFFNKGTAAETQALKNINLQIKPGQFVIFIGGNGAGKSTLLSSLCGEVECDGGRISIAGQDITSWNVAQRAGLIGRVFQDPMAGTCSELSVAENLSLALQRGHKRSLSKALNAEKEQQFRQAIASLNLGLENRLHDPIGLLSGGQRQAISLVMAALSPMQVLILDEHTAALDPKTAAFILAITQHILSEHKLTALMVTHSLHQAVELGDRLIMMHQGEIVMDVAGETKQKLRPADLLNAFDELGEST